MRKIEVRVNVDLAALPGPLVFLMGLGCRCLVVVSLVRILLLGRIVWVCFIILLPFWALHTGLWITGDMGHFGVSYLEVLILFEHWLGHRLLSEKVARMHLRAHRPTCFPPAPVSEGIQIRQGCQFISSLFRALGKLSGGVGRFIPCVVGGHMSRLRHLGWLQCSHGLTSRPLESYHHACLRAMCDLLGYPCGAAAELLDGTLKLRYCTSTFSTKLSPWSIPGVHGRSGVGNCTTTPGGSGEVQSVRVWLTRKSQPELVHRSLVVKVRTLGIQCRGDGKIALPFLRRSGERGGRASQSFSSTWGWVRFAPGTPGTCLRREQV